MGRVFCVFGMDDLEIGLEQSEVREVGMPRIVWMQTLNQDV